MSKTSQPHLLTNPRMDNPGLVGQFESKLLPHISARLAVVRLVAGNRVRLERQQKKR